MSAADLSALAAAAVALPGWKWRQGMQAAIPADALRGYERSLVADGSDYSFGVVGDWPGAVHPAAVPVLSDPATGGALLALLCASGCTATVEVCGDEVHATFSMPGNVWHKASGASLGEAVARIALMLGRWA